MRTRRRSLAALLLLAGCGAAHAQALLHELFQDHAVLQRNRPIAVWGRAAPHDAISVSLGNLTARAQADATGHWSATLPPLGAGGPFVLTAAASSGARQSVSDVLLGDVFLCSGQSNMELAVRQAGDAGNEINNSTNPQIRMLSVRHASSPVPLSDFPDPVAWQAAAPATVPDWSAACFYFARELQKSVHVAIGLVHSSWGGSNIRPWMSAGALRAFDAYRPAIDTLALYAKDPDSAQKQFAGQWESWWRSRSGDRAGAEPWSGADPGAWRTVPTAMDDWRNWHVPELANFNGVMWLRTRITLSAAQAAQAATLNLGPINQVDQTWINGRPVGNTFGYGTERTYKLPAGMLHAGENLLVINVMSTYNGGGLLAGGAARSLHPSTGAAVPLQGPWEYRIAPAALGWPPRSPWEPVGGMTTIYNAMIAPMGAFGFRAALWYQGESNTDEADTYQGLLSGLMADWRHQFGAALAFLVVQLPNYGPQPTAPGESGWATVREAQRRAVAADQQAGLAVTIDIGDAHNLHPGNKQDVGRRLARAARHVVYGETLAPSGPIPRQARREAGGVRVDFTDVEHGLVAYSHERPIGFELCGRQAGSCHYVQATIQGSQILLSVPATLAMPQRVRYCWADSPVCTLFDGSGLPAGPFELPISP